MPLAHLDLRGVPSAALAHRLPAPTPGQQFPTAEVAAILDEVRVGGDRALAELTAKFDGAAAKSLRVAGDEIAAALAAVPAQLRGALELAFARIRAYHSHVAREEPAAF